MTFELTLAWWMLVPLTITVLYLAMIFTELHRGWLTGDDFWVLTFVWVSLLAVVFLTRLLP